jgi:O-acetyl-ADP-ribose deacetylase (regulator of RNase III)
MNKVSLLFLDNNPEFAELISQKFSTFDSVLYSIRTFTGDVREISIEYTAFISPSNSLLFFDGGYDKALQEMFATLQEKARSQLKELNLYTKLGRPYLPVGSSMIIPFGKTTCVVAAPTMFLPHDVSNTRNAYHALTAALRVLCLSSYYNEIHTIVVPAMCCGYGKMSLENAVQQMYEAVVDYSHGKRSECRNLNLKNIYIGPQPDNFDNREIKN